MMVPDTFLPTASLFRLPIPIFIFTYIRTADQPRPDRTIKNTASPQFPWRQQQCTIAESEEQLP